MSYSDVLDKHSYLSNEYVLETSPWHNQLCFASSALAIGLTSSSLFVRTGPASSRCHGDGGCALDRACAEATGIGSPAKAMYAVVRVAPAARRVRSRISFQNDHCKATSIAAWRQCR